MKMQVAGLTAAFADIVAQTEAELPVVLKTWGEKALPFVKDEWPKKTGRSRAALSLDVQGENIFLSCNVDYASYIYQSGTVGPTWRILMVDRLVKLTPVINAAVTAELARTR